MLVFRNRQSLVSYLSVKHEQTLSQEGVDDKSMLTEILSPKLLLKTIIQYITMKMVFTSYFPYHPSINLLLEISVTIHDI